jgi:PKHD-type hydroxylase
MIYSAPRTWEHSLKCQKLDNIFTYDECKKIIALHEGLKVKESRRKNQHRNTDVYWLDGGVSDYKWIFERIGKRTHEFNDSTYQFELEGCYPLQLGRYRPGQHFEWHRDITRGSSSRRKLTVTIKLSEDEAFTGGVFQHGTDKFPRTLEVETGSGIAFPSWTYHRVTPVETGERWSLTAWWQGPPFR